MEKKEHVYRRTPNIYIQGERLTDLIETFQHYVDQYGSSVRLEYYYEYRDWDNIYFYLEYKDIETDEEYAQRLASREIALKTVEAKERKLLKELLEKYAINI